MSGFKKLKLAASAGLMGILAGLGGMASAAKSSGTGGRRYRPLTAVTTAINVTTAGATWSSIANHKQVKSGPSSLTGTQSSGHSSFVTTGSITIGGHLTFIPGVPVPTFITTNWSPVSTPVFHSGPPTTTSVPAPGHWSNSFLYSTPQGYWTSISISGYSTFIATAFTPTGHSTFVTNPSRQPIFAVADGTLTTGRDDAFDYGMMCNVNGTTYASPSSTIDRTAVSGGVLITPPATNIGGLDVQLTYFASNTHPVLRGICSITNTTGGTLQAVVKMGSNFGSDEMTTIRNSSSGDAVVGASDRWFVSDDQGSGPDPVLLIGRYGVNASVLPTLVQQPGVPAAPNANDSFVDQYTLNVAPGQTVRIMQLAWLNTSVAQANTHAASFDSTTTLQTASQAGINSASLHSPAAPAPVNLLGGLSANEISEIVNFGPSSPTAQTPPAEIPTLDELGELALMVLVGASGMLYLTRRRREGDEAGV